MFLDHVLFFPQPKLWIQGQVPRLVYCALPSLCGIADMTCLLNQGIFYSKMVKHFLLFYPWRACGIYLIPNLPLTVKLSQDFSKFIFYHTLYSFSQYKLSSFELCAMVKDTGINSVTSPYLNVYCPFMESAIFRVFLWSGPCVREHKCWVLQIF